MRLALGSVLLSFCLVISGCTSFELISEMSKSRTVVDPSSVVAGNGNRYKIGLPYRIKGITYHPEVDYSYEEIGVASWYGESFHGKLTANGAVFNMHAVSAAHRTLPLPSWVEVENLRNGRKLVIKVNDRGPFHDNRIIDVSRRAAELLGFKRDGVARVRVRILAKESKRLAEWMKRGQKSSEPKIDTARAKNNVTLTRVQDGIKAPIVSVKKAPLRDIEGSKTLGNTLPLPVSGLYVQIAAFTQYARAVQVRNQINGYQSTVGLSPSPDDSSKQLYKVLVGPFMDVQTASKVRNTLKSMSYPGAHLISWSS